MAARMAQGTQCWSRVRNTREWCGHQFYSLGVASWQVRGKVSAFILWVVQEAVSEAAGLTRTSTGQQLNAYFFLKKPCSEDVQEGCFTVNVGCVALPSSSSLAMSYLPQHYQELWPIRWPGAVDRSSCVGQEVGEGAALSRGAGEVWGQLGASMRLAGTQGRGGTGTARPELLVVPSPPWDLKWLCSEHGLQRRSTAFLVMSERWTGTEHLGAHKQSYNNKPTGPQGWHLPSAHSLGNRKLARGRSVSIACLPNAALWRTAGKGAAGAISRQRDTMHFVWLQAHWQTIFILASCSWSACTWLYPTGTPHVHSSGKKEWQDSWRCRKLILQIDLPESLPKAIQFTSCLLFLQWCWDQMGWRQICSCSCAC